MPAIPCPKVDSPEFDALVKSYGEDPKARERAHLEYFREHKRLQLTEEGMPESSSEENDTNKKSGITHSDVAPLQESMGDIGNSLLKKTTIVQTPEEAIAASSYEWKNPEAYQAFQERIKGGRTQGFFDGEKAIVILDNIKKRPGESNADAIKRLVMHENLGHRLLRHAYANDVDTKKEIDSIIEAIKGSEEGWGRDLSGAYPELLSEGKEFDMFQEWFNSKVERGDPDQMAKEDSLFARAWNAIKDFIYRRFHHGEERTPKLEERISNLARELLKNHNVEGRGDVAESKEAISRRDLLANIFKSRPNKWMGHIAKAGAQQLAKEAVKGATEKVQSTEVAESRSQDEEAERILNEMDANTKAVMAPRVRGEKKSERLRPASWLRSLIRGAKEKMQVKAGQMFGVKNVSAYLAQNHAPMMEYVKLRLDNTSTKELLEEARKMIEGKLYGETLQKKFTDWHTDKYGNKLSEEGMDPNLRHTGDAVGVFMQAEMWRRGMEIAKKTGDKRILNELEHFGNESFIGGLTTVTGAARILAARKDISKEISYLEIKQSLRDQKVKALMDTIGIEGLDAIESLTYLTDEQVKTGMSDLDGLQDHPDFKILQERIEKANAERERIAEENDRSDISDQTIQDIHGQVSSLSSQLTERIEEFKWLLNESQKTEEGPAQATKWTAAKSERLQELLHDRKSFGSYMKEVFEHLKRTREEIGQILQELDLQGEAIDGLEGFSEESKSKLESIKQKIYRSKQKFSKDERLKDFLTNLKKPKPKTAKVKDEMKDLFWDQIKRPIPRGQKTFVEEMNKLGYSKEGAKKLYDYSVIRRKDRLAKAEEARKQRDLTKDERKAQSIIEDYIKRYPSALSGHPPKEFQDSLQRAFDQETKFPHTDNDEGWKAWQERIQDFKLNKETSRQLFDLSHSKRDLFDMSGKDGRSFKSLFKGLLEATVPQQQDPEWIKYQLTEFLKDNGFKPQEAKERAEKVSDEWYKILKKTRIDAMEKVATHLPKMAEALSKKGTKEYNAAENELKRIRQAIRLGIFDPMDSLGKELAEKAGYKELTSEDNKNLIDWDVEMENANIPRQLELATKMHKLLASKGTPMSWAKITTNSLRNSMLSSLNLFNLHATMGGFTHMWRLATDLGAEMFIPSKGTRMESLHFTLRNFFDSFKRSIHEWVNSAKTDSYSMRPLEILKHFSGMEREHENAYKAMTGKDSTPLQRVKGAVQWLQTSTDLVHRILSTSTQGWHGTMEENIFRNTAVQHLMKAGEGGKRMSAADVHEILNESLERSQEVANQRIKEGWDASAAKIDGWTEGRKVIEKAVESLHGEEAVKDIQLTASKDASLGQGYHHGDEGYALGAAGQALTNMLTGMRNEHPFWGSILTGFVRVPWNLLNSAAWASPYGLARLGLYKYRKSKGLSNPYEKMNLATQSQVRNRMIEAIAGTVTLGLMLALRKKHEDDDGFGVTLNGPSGKAANDAWLARGHHKFSLEFKTGDKIVAIPFGRGGLERVKVPALVAGALDDMELNHQGKDPRKLESVAEFSEIALKGFFDQANFFGLKNLPTGHSGNKTLTRELAESMSYTGSAIIPWSGMIRSITKMLTEAPDTSTTEAFVKAQIPVTSAFTGENGINVLGDRIKDKPSDIFTNVSNRLWYGGLPIALQVSNESSPVYGYMLQSGNVPSMPVRSLVEGKLGKPMTDEMWHMYCQTRGKSIKSDMTRQLTELYKSDKDTAKHIIQSIDKSANDKALRSIGVDPTKKTH